MRLFENVDTLMSSGFLSSHKANGIDSIYKTGATNTNDKKATPTKTIPQTHSKSRSEDSMKANHASDAHIEPSRLETDCSVRKEDVENGIIDSKAAAVEGGAHRQEHLGRSRQYWRDMILGVNDGLVSTFLLVAGVAGGGLSVSNVLLTALASALAGAISMGAGEYVATKSQNQVLQGEIALERQHVDEFRAEEVKELGDLLVLIGIDQNTDLSDQLIAYYRDRPDALHKIMVALEFGVLEEQGRSPIQAGLFSSVLFVAGSLPSVLPFLLVDETTTGLIAAALLTTVSLLLVGAIKTWATRGRWLTAALENLAIASVGGGLSYSAGLLLDVMLN